ncbi:hypothetical protein CMI45_03410 [Candidatus Pacearchaeota archaeon]|nr:hypothetical protein [Candidatus Pacearchaeota archaeon]
MPPYALPPAGLNEYLRKLEELKEAGVPTRINDISKTYPKIKVVDSGNKTCRRIYPSLVEKALR